MATTTNYGWTTPDDTGLVKDGASAIRSLGTAIDTTVKSNADAAIAKTIVDAKGDLIAATAADTVSRLAVGSNDQVLIADSTTATGLKWGTPSSGGMTLLSTTTLSGASTTISSISGDYKTLIGYVYGITATANNYPTLKPNGANNNQMIFIVNSGVSTSTAKWYLHTGAYSMDSGNSDNVCAFIIQNYSSTASYKPIQSYGGFVNSSYQEIATIGSGYFYQNSAITSLEFNFNSAGPTYSSGTVLLYGVK